MEIVVSLIIIALVAILSLFSTKNAIKIMVFFIPIVIIPFKKIGLLVPLSGYLIIVIWICMKLKSLFGFKIVSWRVISKKVTWLYYVLILGIILGLLKNDIKLDYVTEISNNLQILNFSLYIIIVIFFCKILVNFQYDTRFQKDLMVIFSLTIFLNLFSIIFTRFDINLPLPAFISEFIKNGYYVHYSGLVRYFGLLSSYELIVDYCLIIIGLCLFLYFRGHKYLPFLGTISSVLVALFSGTRSFIIIFVVFVICFVLLSSYYGIVKKSVEKYILILPIAFVLLLFIYFDFLENLPIFVRFRETVDLIRSGEYLLATNRDIGGIGVVLRKINFLGNGSLFFTTVGSTNFVSHNLYLAIYAKYGIWGLFLIVYLFYQILHMLKQIIKRKDIKVNYRIQSAIYYSIFVSLIIQQLKISSIRSVTYMLNYTFFFINIYFFSKSIKVMKCD